MKKISVLSISIIALMLLAMAGLFSTVTARPLGATSPSLGGAGSFSVMGAETVTNTGSTTTAKAVGVSPGTEITGFPPGIAGGTGTHSNDADAIAAHAAVNTIFGALDQGCTQTFAGTYDLVGSDLQPGVYCAPAFALSGTLTLSGSGVWIFKSAAALNVTGTANVVGGDPCNVWWRVTSSATLGTGTSLIGNVVAQTSISMLTGAKLDGRALAYTGAVTLDANKINGPVCSQAASSTAAADATAPAVGALPDSGGAAPVQTSEFPWGLMVIGASISTIALFFGIRAYRKNYLPKQ